MCPRSTDPGRKKLNPNSGKEDLDKLKAAAVAASSSVASALVACCQEQEGTQSPRLPRYFIVVGAWKVGQKPTTPQLALRKAHDNFSRAQRRSCNRTAHARGVVDMPSVGFCSLFALLAMKH